MFVKSLSTLAAVTAFAGTAAATPLVFSFEGGTDGFTAATDSRIGGTDTTLEFSTTTGVTDGLQSLRVVADGQELDDDGSGNPDDFELLISNFDGTVNPDTGIAPNALFEGGGTLTVDVTIPEAGPGAGESGAQVFLARQGTNTPFDVTDGSGNFQFPGIGFGGTSTLSYVLPNIAGTNDLDDGGFYGFTIGVQFAGADTDIFFDNFVFTPGDDNPVVPEPASLALLGLGAAAMMGRRRK